jgi:hypothetical protein
MGVCSTQSRMKQICNYCRFSTHDAEVIQCVRSAPVRSTLKGLCLLLSMPYTWQDFSSGLHDSSFSVRVCMSKVCDLAIVSGCRMEHLSMGRSVVTDTHSPGHQVGDSCTANTSLQASPGPLVCEQRLTQQARVWTHRKLEPNMSTHCQHTCDAQLHSRSCVNWGQKRYGGEMCLPHRLLDCLRKQAAELVAEAAFPNSCDDDWADDSRDCEC